MDFRPDVSLGVQNLLAHKMRSLLTMLGMIFGVAAVVSMLSIGAGAQQQVMAFIEQLGVHNLIVEAKEANDYQTLGKVRKISPGLTLHDYRMIQADLVGIEESTPRKRYTPTKLLPKPQREMPTVFGIGPNYQKISSVRIAVGRFFDGQENEGAAPVCVLGEGAKENLFGDKEAIGKFVKINEQWFRVIGVAASQLSSPSGVTGLASQDQNNLILIPLNSALLRAEDSYADLKDEIDGIYLRLNAAIDPVSAGESVRSLLNVTHRNAGDFSIVAPAELLAEQKRTQRIFDMVMVAIASISLLVGGIGIMNIMLASVLERTHEIGLRRAVGARRADIVRQFLMEGILISVVGGLIGILFGFGLSRLIALLAGWSTIVTTVSILLAFLVSVSVGLIFGIYPAIRAARLDPVEALRYE